MGFQAFHYSPKLVIGFSSLFEVARVFPFLSELVLTDTIPSSKVQKRAIISQPSSKTLRVVSQLRCFYLKPREVHAVEFKGKEIGWVLEDVLGVMHSS